MPTATPRRPRDAADDTAAGVRQAIRAARRAGTLGLPAGTRVRVRVERWPHRSSVEINIDDVGPWAYDRDAAGRPRMGAALLAAGQRLADLAAQLRTDPTVGAVAYYNARVIIGRVNPREATP